MLGFTPTDKEERRDNKSYINLNTVTACKRILRKNSVIGLSFILIELLLEISYIVECRSPPPN